MVGQPPPGQRGTLIADSSLVCQPRLVEGTDSMKATTTVPLVAETADVRKVDVDTGGYRITRRVSTRNEQIDEQLLSESVQIERRAIGQPVSVAPEVRREGDTLIVPVLEEVLVTEKRLMLVEEVRITRVQHTRRDTQTVPLREESIHIERLEPQGDPGPQPTQRQTER